ncbi:MAG: dephospho-CoA kinase [Planctomycetaceae bacterium]|nr:dephospho-CoA kinase [Planctomycetaceae bacterium]
MSQRSVPLVGLIGGIGSGKSTVADAAATKVRAVRLDADATGHLALQQPAIKRRLREAFGDTIFDEQGAIVRKALAAAVFGDDVTAEENRAILNSIVHPWIRSQHLATIAEHIERGDCDVILLDAAVLLEAGWGKLCDAIAYIAAPLEQRIQRVANRGWDAAELARREASQLSLDQKRSSADVIIDNSGTVEAAGTQLAQFLQSLILPQSTSTP